LAERRTRFEQWVEQALSEALSGVSEQGPGFLANHLLEAQASLGRQVRGFQDRLAGAIEQALGLTFEGAHFQAELAAPRHLDVRLGKVFDTRVDLLWFLIPMGLFSPLFDRHFLGLIPWEVEKNLARLANQWAEAAEACIDGLVAQALAFMRRELSTLEALTLPSTGSEKALQQALDLLEQVPDEPQ
jgi:hypothetical protein